MKGAAIQDVIARVEAAGAEPSAEAAGEASQENGATSAEGSASADASTPDAAAAPSEQPGAASPEAPIQPPDEAELRAKLERDRERREAKAAIRRAKEEAQRRAELERQLKERDEREAARKSKTWLERLKEEGEDPRKAYEALRDEALKAGTPEAQIEQLTKAFESKLTAVEAQLKAEREARETREKQIAEAEQERVFGEQFQRALSMDAFKPLLEEYEPEDLFPIVRGMRDNPEALFAHAERLGVDLGIDLTDPDASFNMGHIFQVLRAQQAAHEAKKQRRNQSAAPHQSQPAPPAEAKKPTVNGAEARKAGTTIGNDLAASSAGAPPDASHEDHKARLKRLIEKYG